MSEYEPTSPRKIFPSECESGRSGPTTDEGVNSAASASPLPHASSCSWPVSATMVEHTSRPRARRSLPRIRRGLIMAAATVGSMTGLFIGLGTSSPASAAQSIAGRSSDGHLGSVGEGSNARSGPAAGGTSGTVGSVSKSSFTLMTSAAQEVTVDEVSSTKYVKGTSPTSKSAITTGRRVLVLGTVNSTNIKATQVLVQTAGGRSVPATAATVVPFQRGAAETSKQVGQIPSSYSQGSGTLVGGTTAIRATEAALAAYPGGIVDRVVKLSNGEYEVHNIGVNWPHHVFVNQDFKVVGAE